MKCERVSVHVVQHLHIHNNGHERVKMVGGYASRSSAEDAVQRLATKSGLPDFPSIIDSLHTGNSGGF